MEASGEMDFSKEKPGDSVRGGRINYPFNNGHIRHSGKIVSAKKEIGLNVNLLSKPFAL